MKPSTSAALIPASSRQALMHSRCSECVLASGRLPTLVSATPTMAYLPEILLMWSSVSSVGVMECWSHGILGGDGVAHHSSTPFRLYFLTPSSLFFKLPSGYR